MLIIEGFTYENQWTPDKWEAVAALWPCMSAGAKCPTPDKASWHYETTFPCPQRMTMDEVAAIEACGVKLKIQGVDGTMLVKMKDRDKWALGDDAQARDLMASSAVQITVADFALLMIDEVTWEDDCCTQEVQEKLNAGWRILAVCPPNAARRPDYIFGRNSKNAPKA